MSKSLAQYHASSGAGQKLLTFQLESAAFDTKWLIAAFDDTTATLEDGGTQVTFEACGIGADLPERADGAEMELNFGIDNVTGEARKLIDAARKASADVYITTRFYFADDLSSPCEAPIKFIVTSAATTRTTCTASAGIGYLSNSAWPRERFTIEYNPGLATLS